jgi:chemotaxis family two-component system sensor kinase Cph1
MAQSAVILADESLLGVPITLNNCEREPIHIPGLIQPYGFLLCLDEATRRVVQASANTQSLLGLAPEELLGAGLEQLLGPAQLAEIEALWPSITTASRLLGVRLDSVAGQPGYKLVLHRHDGLLWVEGEPVADSSVSALDLPALNLTLSQLLAADTTQAMCQSAVEQVRALTGFDRVAVYRFAADDSGEIIAEAIRPDLGPWLGLHYPATDIPQQARAMYLKNWLRFIPDASYVPTPLVPARLPGASRPPDMTYAMLRSVSPIHIQYLLNMGSAATMTISLIEDGRLWGMITCHHESPRLVSYELRDLCQFLGKTMSTLLKTKERHDELAYQQRISQVQKQLFELMSSQENFLDGLHRFSPTLLDVFDCSGVAICFEGETITLGHTPTKTQLEEVVDWLRANAHQDVFFTNSYTQLNPAGRAIRASASGILAVALAQDPGEYIIWFRPELIQTVTWAGRNEKNQTTVDGQVFLSPRQSFEAWKQTVEDTAAPWKALEIEAAKEIRLFISDVRLRVFNELQARALTLAGLNAELERSNEELDSFAYVASHDLKEPLRGIHNYSIFLLEDYADQLDAEGVRKLQTLVRLSQRMESLIESLLQLSRVSRLELSAEETDLNQDLAEVVDLLSPRFEQTHTTVTVATPLPTLRADRVRLREVFNNLFTNAMRYNDQVDKRIVVGLAPATVRGPKGTGSPTDFYVFYVQDNGIGIAPKHHENIFKIFKRLHAQEKYGGGTGAGLAIAKKMVEKHGGELWVESDAGQGATFYFSVSKHL